MRRMHRSTSVRHDASSIPGSYCLSQYLEVRGSEGFCNNRRCLSMIIIIGVTVLCVFKYLHMFVRWPIVRVQSIHPLINFSLSQTSRLSRSSFVGTKRMSMEHSSDNNGCVLIIKIAWSESLQAANTEIRKWCR